MNLNIDFEICGSLLMLLMVVAEGFRSRNPDIRSERSRTPGLILMFLSFVNVMTAMCVSERYSVPKAVTGSLCGITIAMMCAVPMMLTRYAYLKLRHSKKRRRVFTLLSTGWYVVALALIVSTGFTKWIFYVDEDRGYYHGKYFWVLYAVTGIYLFVFVRYMIMMRKKLERTQIVLLSSMVFFELVPLLFSLFLPGVPVYSLCLAAGYGMMYLDNGSSTARTDNTTLALNREALISDICSMHNDGVYPEVYVIALDNFKIVNEIYGVDGGNQLMRALVRSLRRRFGTPSVYRFSGDIFAVTGSIGVESKKDLDSIKHVLGQTYRLNDSDVRLSACICHIHSADHKGRAIVSAIEYAVTQVKSMGKAQFLEVEESFVGQMKRRKAIEQEIVKNLNEGHFEVHYQPIYDVKRQSFHSMEALARLNVPDYGYVSPEEFVRIAEKNGTILQIGLLVLDEVCRFIKSADLQSRGIDFIEVNLSVMQCMQKRICDDVKSVIRKYDIPPQMINLEITESAAAYSEQMLIRNMARMSLLNVTFSLDDYGSGYSNINYLVDLPFSIAKIDKYVVWAASQSVKSRLILENTVAMFKDINLKVVAEGIESKEMAEMAIKAGVDYIQGFYYSKPLPRDKVLSCLEGAYLARIQWGDPEKVSNENSIWRGRYE